jgi:hypothetical protein
MQWDPGVMWNLSGEGIHIFSAWPRRTIDQISRLRRRFLHKSLSLLQQERAIAWGQAMFLGGGIVMTGTLGDVGLGLIGHRLVTMGWDCRSMATKEKLHTGKGREQN